MPFEGANWNPISAGGQAGPATFSYSTTDSAADLDTAGYFNPVAAQLKVNDRIYAVTSTGTTAVHGDYIVRSKVGNVVDVADRNAIAVTNTD